MQVVRGGKWDLKMNHCSGVLKDCVLFWPRDYGEQTWMRPSITLPFVLNVKNKAPEPTFLCHSVERNWLLLCLFFPLTGLPCQEALQIQLRIFFA